MSLSGVDAPAGPGRSARARRAASVLDVGGFVGSSVAFQAVRLALNVVAAERLGPAGFALWAAITTLLSYTTHANLGVVSGANRLVPVAIGAGRPDEARAIEASALAGVLATGVVVGVIIGGAFVMLTPGGLGLGLAVGLVCAAQQAALLYQASLRARLEFPRASITQAAMAVTVAVAGLPLLLSLGVAGLALSMALAYGVAAALVALAWRRGLRPERDLDRLLSTARDGVPIVLSGLAFAALTTVDRWAVLVIGGDAALGRYGLAATVAAGLTFVTLLLAQRTYPRLAVGVGAGEDVDRLRDRAVRHTLATVALVGAGAALLVGAATLVPALLPDYAPAAPALQALALANVTLAAGNGPANLLIAVGRAWTNVVLQLVALAAIAIGVVVSMTLDPGDLGRVGVVVAAGLGLYSTLAWVAVVRLR